MDYKDYINGMDTLKQDEPVFEILERNKTLFNLGKAVKFIEINLDIDIHEYDLPYVPYDVVMDFNRIEDNI